MIRCFLGGGGSWTQCLWFKKVEMPPVLGKRASATETRKGRAVRVWCSSHRDAHIVPDPGPLLGTWAPRPHPSGTGRPWQGALLTAGVGSLSPKGCPAFKVVKSAVGGAGRGLFSGSLQGWYTVPQ